MGQTFLKIGQNIARSAKACFFLCLQSNSKVYGLLLHLEQISNVHAPSDKCLLEEFRVLTTFLAGALIVIEVFEQEDLGFLMCRLCAHTMADLGHPISQSAGWLELLAAGKKPERLTTCLAEEGASQEDILLALLPMYTRNAMRPALDLVPAAMQCLCVLLMPVNQFH